MNFSNDRDLLAIEPNLFNEVSFVAQQRLSVSDGLLSGTSLVSAGADFIAAEVDAGSVLLIDSTPYEVIARTDATTLEVSLLRSRTDAAALPGGDGGGLSVIVRTFTPQAALVHDDLLRLLGLGVDSGLDKDAVVSWSLVARLEAIGTLERVYSAASALGGDNAHVILKAAEYRQRFQQACRRVSVLIDVNGDGIAEEKRELGLIGLRRI